MCCGLFPCKLGAIWKEAGETVKEMDFLYTNSKRSETIDACYCLVTAVTPYTACIVASSLSPDRVLDIEYYIAAQL